MAKDDVTKDKIDCYTPPTESNWANKARADALSWLNQNGLPNGREEYWKYTNPLSFNSSNPPVKNEIDPSYKKPIFDEINCVKIAFVDGILDLENSDDLFMAGIEIEPLAKANKNEDHWSLGYFGNIEGASQKVVKKTLASLNTAFATEGLTIKITDKASKPISIVYYHTDEMSEALIHHVIKVEKNAYATLLESGGISSRSNCVMELSLEENASLDHIRVQGRSHERESITYIFSNLEANSCLKSFTLTVNGRLTRNEYVVNINGENAKAHVGGAIVGDTGFSHDDTVFITHSSPNCESRQVFKKVLRNGAKGVFQGKILVKEGAQKTDGYQISQGLMLDNDSNFLAKPDLVIYADDVICSHGSTCGEIDPTALFYLTSRGIPKSEAQDMLVLAFLNEAIDEITSKEIQEIISKRLLDWMLKRHKA